MLIIIVLYKQSLMDCTAFKSIRKAVDQSTPPSLFVYDNSPMVNARPYLNSWEITYNHDPSNPGVSKAYNEGYKVAVQLEKKWLLLVDQDTEFPSTIFTDYEHAIQEYPKVNMFTPFIYDSIGQLSPFRLIFGKGARINTPEKDLYSFKNYKVINSGSLISAFAFEGAGGYDERFPLDYSDISFSERLSTKDECFVLVSSKCLQHFSSTSKPIDRIAEMERFLSFCKATQRFKKISDEYVNLCWVILPRSLKLSFQRMDYRFLKIGLQHFLQE